ncbi:MAG TPA: metal ABC transporter ATP-binding protein [Thermodesulfobacteriota bacterium]|nr:metal ABC transporter ATP-binding protein [Thermodesulfobacteriota bacterium]
MNRSDPLISVENVSFSFNGLEVIQNVTFAISPGDFMALIGPNGSGKSTLIRIIVGILKPSTGRVVIMGEELGQFTQWQRVGYVPQKATHMDPYFPASVREVVAMGLISKKRFPRLLTRQDEAVIDRALDQVDMKALKNRRIGELSGGQQQRVFIARAIVNGPDVLFLDEPTAGVDADTQTRFYEMLADLNRKEGLTIVLITHDFGIITRHVNKVACLNQRLFFHGTHDDFCSSSVVQELLHGEHHLICHRH